MVRLAELLIGDRLRGELLPQLPLRGARLLRPIQVAENAAPAAGLAAGALQPGHALQGVRVALQARGTSGKRIRVLVLDLLWLFRRAITGLEYVILLKEGKDDESLILIEKDVSYTK